MRVVFLGSAYFGYVYAYMFDPEGYADRDIQPALAASEARPTLHAGQALTERLTAWLSRRKQGALC